MGDDKIVVFPGKRSEESTDEYVLVCHCGCITHFIHEDQRVVCGSCDCELSPNGHKWGSLLPKLDPANVTVIDRGSHVIRFVNAQATVASRLDKLDDWNNNDTLCLLAGYCTDGNHTVWAGIETEEQREWALRQVEDIKKWLQEMKL